MSAEICNKAQLQLTEKQDEDIVDPWNVTSTLNTGVDYDKLIRKFISFIFPIKITFYYFVLYSSNEFYYKLRFRVQITNKRISFVIFGFSDFN